MKLARGVMRKQGLVTAVFYSKEAASDAYQELMKKGYRPADVTVLMAKDTYHAILGKPGDGEVINDKVFGLQSYLRTNGNTELLPRAGLIVAGPTVAADVNVDDLGARAAIAA